MIQVSGTADQDFRMTKVEIGNRVKARRPTGSAPRRASSAQERMLGVNGMRQKHLVRVERTGQRDRSEFAVI
jgi:hypothetical protein